MKKSAAIKIFLNKAKNKIILICTDKTKKISYSIKSRLNILYRVKFLLGLATFQSKGCLRENLVHH